MYSLAGLFWRNDPGCASVIPSEQTSSSYIILYNPLSNAWGSGTKMRKWQKQPRWCVHVQVCRIRTWAIVVGNREALSVKNDASRQSGPHTKCIEAGDVTGVGVSSLFRSPATLDRNNSVSVALLTSCFAIKNLSSRAFDRGVACRNRARIDRETRTFVWLSLKWYGRENVYNRDRQRPDTLANTYRSRALNWNWES